MTTALNRALKTKKLFVFDMDGTVFLGGRVFDFAVRFIKNLRESGRRVLFSQTMRRTTRNITMTSSAGWASTRRTARS